MATNNSVTLRLGSTGSEMVVADLRKIGQAATQELGRSAALTRQQFLAVQYTVNDVAASLATGASPLTILMQQGGQLTQSFGGLRQTAAALGPALARALFSPIGAASALAASLVGVQVAGDRAFQSLVKLGEASKRTGLSAETLQGAKIVGARAGLNEEETIGAFTNASKQFEQFARNEGAVKSALEKIDSGFLKVVDRARTAGEFIDIIEQKIRALPRAEGLDLAQSLFGDEAGLKLFDAIERGQASMRALSDVAAQAGVEFNGAAERALDMQRRIDEAAEIASVKLLDAFRDLGDPVDSIKLGWYEIVGQMAQAVSQSETLQAILRGLAHPVDTIMEAPGRIAATLSGETFHPAMRGRLIPLDQAGIVQPRETAGASRQRFAARAESARASGRRRRGGAAGDRFGDITGDLQNRISLAASEGAEHDQITLKIKIENEQRRLGKDATQAQKDEVASLVTKLDEAERAQKALTQAGESYRDTLKEVGDLSKDALKSLISDLRQGESAGQAFERVLERILDRALSSGIDDLIEGFSGKGGKGKKGGGFLSEAFSSFFDKSGGGGGFFDSIKGFFGFAEGGVMTAQGPVPLRRYAAGGIASSPQMALFGEAGMPEAYVPLPDGRSIPVALNQNGAEPRVTVHNYSGAQVQTSVTHNEVALIIGQAIDANNRNLPAIMRDRQRRSL